MNTLNIQSECEYDDDGNRTRKNRHRTKKTYKIYHIWIDWMIFHKHNKHTFLFYHFQSHSYIYICIPSICFFLLLFDLYMCDVCFLDSIEYKTWNILNQYSPHKYYMHSHIKIIFLEQQQKQHSQFHWIEHEKRILYSCIKDVMSPPPLPYYEA